MARTTDAAVAQLVAETERRVDQLSKELERLGADEARSSGRLGSFTGHPARDGCGSCRASAAHQYAAGVINGGHVIIYSGDAEADRAFFRDVLDYPHVDAGAGWLIFKLPPSEIAVHPVDGPPVHELYLMCDDLDATMAQLTAKGAAFAAVTEARWGRLTQLRLPGGGELGLYEPRHPRATEL
ncbi:MAG: hypothetical protein V7607_3034 [Solirubrobacteraceae bacterium]